MTEAFPLQWPAGKPRTANPERSRFGDKSIDQATKTLCHELRRLGAAHITISTNIRLRGDGLPYSSQKPPADKGVAVYFTYKQKAMCFSCDRWDRIQDNIYAIAMTIDALRGIERWGGGKMMEEAFTGFVALPAPKSPEEVLGVRQGASQDEIETAYRAMAKIWHPDKLGGSQEKMQEINNARERLLA